MPLPGGASEKLGNRYEVWWTVLCLLEILANEAESIRIEEPGEDSIEFVLVRKGKKEYHQAKRARASGPWTISALGSDKAGVLKAIKEKLSDSDSTFVFVSGSESSELHELSDRSKDAESYREFSTKFLQAKSHSDSLQSLQRFWDDVGPEVAYELLKQITVRTIDERSLIESTKNLSRALFVLRPERAVTELRAIVCDSVHRRLTREDLVDSLKGRGILLRKVQNPQDILNVVRQATDDYLIRVRRKLIGGALIHRHTAESLCQKVLTSQESLEIALVGKAGGGKTANLIQLTQGLRDGGVEVLAFRLDRIEPVYSSRELGEKLGLEESPALITASLAAHGPTALVIDQLDALSTVSGRGTEAFYEAIEQVLGEVRGLRAPHPIHVIVACRAFDWSNDVRFRSMLRNCYEKIDSLDFTVEEIKQVLSERNFDVGVFEVRQTKLLCLPRNLALFLESHVGSEKELNFLTEKDLFDEYWTEKRRAINLRLSPHPDHWDMVIQKVIRIVGESEQLFSPKEKLDDIDQVYLEAMCSENVLTFDGKRYGFGHESFYDYCFARSFVSNGRDLCDVLKEGTQALFVRSMVRQVLVYMRDSNFSKYIQQLDLLLSNEHIRVHLKDLVLGLLSSLPEPKVEEWLLFKNRIDEFLKLERNKSHYGSLEALVWQHFSSSSTLFGLAYARGDLNRWLTLDGEPTSSELLRYFYYEQRDHAEEISELLEPWVGVSSIWNEWVRKVLAGTRDGRSRRSFELMLRLLELGALDSSLFETTGNDPFWSMCDSWVDSKPEWLPELISNWLERRLGAFLSSGQSSCCMSWSQFLEQDRHLKRVLFKTAEKAPGEYVSQILPVALRIVRAAIVQTVDELPQVDCLETSYVFNDVSTTKSALRESMLSALVSLHEKDDYRLSAALILLRRERTNFSNHLLLRLYTNGGKVFAEEAAQLICEEPWRLSCGYIQNDYWVSTRLLEDIFPHLSAGARKGIERTVLDFVPIWERRAEHGGYLEHGRACFDLLSGIPEKLLSSMGRKRVQELVRKFKSPSGPPQVMEASFVESPIPHHASGKMTDAQWIRAINKYNDVSLGMLFENPRKGGRAQLAGELESCVKREPERFLRLATQLPSDTNPVFFSRILRSLEKYEGLDELKSELCRKVFSLYPIECGKEIAQVLPGFQQPIPEDLLDMLRWMIEGHPDPATELWDEDSNGGSKYYGGDIFLCGLNTARGSAAGALRELISREPTYIDTLGGTLRYLVGDSSVAVRACAATTLMIVYSHDEDLAVDLFQELVKTDDRLLGTHYVQEFIHWLIRKHIEEVRPTIVRMLGCEHVDVKRGAGRLAGLATLYHECEHSLVGTAMEGDPASRLGIAEIASKNLASVECRGWCEGQLLELFNDEDREVKKCAATCFRSLLGVPFEDYESVILDFCQSKAFETDSSDLIELLIDSTYAVPGVVTKICAQFLDWFDKCGQSGGSDLTIGDSVGQVSQLIFRIYQQHKSNEWGLEALELIDRMCLVGVNAVRGELTEFDR